MSFFFACLFLPLLIYIAKWNRSMIFFDRKESRRDVIFPSKFVEISPFSVSHFSAQMTLPDTRNRTAPILSRGLGLYENLVVIVGKGGIN